MKIKNVPKGYQPRYKRCYQVAQDDEQSLGQELEEYIITRNLSPLQHLLITTQKLSTTQPTKSVRFRASLEAVNRTFLKCSLPAL